ncbi:MAG TPA: hypothetical protein PKA06_16750 [Gemmatales bacterium]|nr:hypothetical protein [Gemmatales bacterium]
MDTWRVRRDQVGRHQNSMPGEVCKRRASGFPANFGGGYCNPQVVTTSPVTPARFSRYTCPLHPPGGEERQVAGVPRGETAAAFC